MDFESYMDKLKEEFNDSGKHTILVVDDLEDNDACASVLKIIFIYICLLDIT